MRLPAVVMFPRLFGWIRLRALLRMLLLSQVGLVVWCALRHTPTWDEPGHLVAGISHWEFGTFDLMRVNPPLVRMVGTVPLLFANPAKEWSRYDASVGARSERWIRTDFIRANGRRDNVRNDAHIAAVALGLVGMKCVDSNPTRTKGLPWVL